MASLRCLLPRNDAKATTARQQSHSVWANAGKLIKRAANQPNS